MRQRIATSRIIRRTISFLGWGLSTGIFVAIPVPGQAAARSSVNFVIIVADDLGYGDLSCYGGKIPTPNIDALAAGGVRFTDFHGNGAMCSPTRAALITGKYPNRSGIEMALPIDPNAGLRAQPTLPGRLKELGYITGVFGKWHLGDESRFSPNRHGFDEFKGLLTGDGDYHSRIDRIGRPDWWKNDQALADAGYSTDLITRYSLSFIREHQNRPFFLYVPHLAPHFPWQGPDDPADRVVGIDYRKGNLKFGSRENKREAYVEMVKALDKSVGRLVDGLRAAGLEKNTLVIFFSDNGGYTVDRGGYVGVSSNAPLRGQKSDMYEGGHRVPALAYWPGRIKAGSVCQEVVMTMDLLPTLLELAGVNVSADQGATDGVSLVDLLLNGDPLRPRLLFWRQNRDKAVRDGKWKLVLNPQGKELYDLSTDVSEQRNVASRYPERVSAMASALGIWEADVDRSRDALLAEEKSQ